MKYAQAFAELVQSAQHVIDRVGPPRNHIAKNTRIIVRERESAIQGARVELQQFHEAYWSRCASITAGLDSTKGRGLRISVTLDVSMDAEWCELRDACAALEFLFEIAGIWHREVDGKSFES